MYRSRRNPPTAEQIYDAVYKSLMSDRVALDELQNNALFYKQVIERALEAKFGKPKPARKRKPKAVAKPKRKATSDTIQLEIKTTGGQSYGMVTLSKSAYELHAFAATERGRLGLSYVQWMQVYSDEIIELADKENVRDRASVSMFVATDGHKLGVIVADRKPPSDVKALMFTPDNWKKAFKSRVLLAELPANYESFPDFVQVLPKRGAAPDQMTTFKAETVDAFLAAKPRISIDSQSSYFAFSGDDVSYRYVPRNLGRDPSLFLTFPFKSLEDEMSSNTPIKRAVFQASYVHSAFALCSPTPLMAIESSASLGPAIVFGRQGAFAVLMPIRYEGESVKAKPIVPFDNRQIPVWDAVTNRLDEKPAKYTAIHKMVTKGLKITKEGSLFIAPVYVGQGPSVEHWVMYGYPGLHTDGCVRLKGELDPFQNTQYPITIKEDEFKGWLQMNWPTLQGVGGEQDSDALLQAQNLVKLLQKNPFENLAFPPLRGMDKLVLNDESRRGLSHVGINEDGNLVASDGHIGLFIERISPAHVRNIGIPAEIFTGLPVMTQTSTNGFASSGHQILPYESAYVPADIKPILDSLTTPDQTVELTPILINQLMRIKKAVKGGYGVIRFGLETKILYLKEVKERTTDPFTGTSSIRRYMKFVAKLPMVKDFPTLSIPFPLSDDEYIAIRVEYLQELLYAMTAEPRTLFLQLRQGFGPQSIDSGDLATFEMTGLVMPMRLDEQPPE